MRSTPSGAPSGFTCPECHGPLWERREGDHFAYRCRVGHVFAENNLLDGKAAAVEAALWMAVEALEERGELLDKVATRMATAGRARTAERLRENARQADERAERIRGVLSVDETAQPAVQGAA
jgi:two-component system chemotaxis response regulator CheB